jgi:hypothetical protein
VELAPLLVAHLAEWQIGRRPSRRGGLWAVAPESLIGLPVRKVQFCDAPLYQT